ncbi:uncharacterized protein [Clytia hemisphaerica]|uniref:uncharacterized protein isoform X2 n=1 Tax=Clytia hemisphaerica TaxID=252671 RepID=UPI0034D5C397
MILVTLLLIGSLFHQAHCVSSVKPANEATSITVQKGDDALFQWNIVLENGDQDVGLKLLNGTTELWTQQTGKVSDAGKELLQERLKVEKSVTNLKATIRNVDFNDSSIELKLTGAISDSGFNKLSDVDSSIALNVQGGPVYCGAQLKSSYNIGLNARRKYELCIESNPAPEITYKFPSDVEEGVKGIVTGPSWDHQYTASFELPSVTAENCGKEMSYTVTTPNLQGSTPLTGKATLTLTDLPLDVTISTFSYEYGIPTVMWRKIEAGLCSDNIVYYMEVSNQTAIISKGPLNGTSQVVDELGNEPKEVVMWAEYDGPTGKKTGQRVTFGFTKTTTTTTTTTTTVETPSPPPSGDDPESGGSNAGAIAGGVIGAIIVLVIIVGVVYYCKAHKTSTSHRSRSNYGANGGEFEYTKNERQDVPQYERPENVVPPSTQTDGGAQQQPQRQKYDELGPGGRVGPRDHVVHSKYAEVKQEEDYGESDQHEDEEGNLVSDSVIV